MTGCLHSCIDGSRYGQGKYLSAELRSECTHKGMTRVADTLGEFGVTT